MNNENAKKTPILICGMHRSGTSLVAQLLNACGLYLGTEDQLMQAHSDDNPAGYWEYLSAVHFADSILSKIGCSWDNPRNLFSDTWLMDLNVEEEKQKAIEIFKPLIGFGKPWGWKDPRATILLPFWKTVFPNLKIIICLRNPLEVALSLSKRNGSTHVDFEKALVLWRDYYEILDRTMQGTEYIVTHYETFFYDSDKELRRICDFSGLSPTTNDIGNIQNIIKSNLYRGVATEKLLKRFDKLPVGLLTLYEGLSAKAGPLYKTMLLDQNYEQSHADMAFKKLFSTSYTNLDQYHYKLRVAKEDIYTKDQELELKEQLLQNLNAQLAEREQEILYYALSKSWRFTRPLRKVTKEFRGKKDD